MAKRERPSGSDKKTLKRAKQEKSKVVPTEDSVENENKNPDGLSKSDAPKSQTKVSSKKKAVFLKKKIDVELSLLPSSLHNTEDAVHNSLNQLLLKYSDGLGGILMGCENVRIITEGDGKGRGWILNELPWIHYTVSCDALVFRPYIGGEVRTSMALGQNCRLSWYSDFSFLSLDNSYMAWSMNAFLPTLVCWF